MKKMACALALVLAACRVPSEPSSEPVFEPSTTNMSTALSVTTSVNVSSLESPEPQVLSRYVLIVGDSQACAVSSHMKEMADSSGDKADIVCKPSTTVQYWTSDRLNNELERRANVDTLVVFLGTNHYLDVSTPPVGSILDVVRSRHLTCVWVGNTAVRGKHRQINSLLHDAVTPTCSYFDTEAYNLRLRDGVHPTFDSARRWAQAVWNSIPVRYDDVKK